MEKEVYDAFYKAEDVHWWFRARRRIVKGLLEDRFPERRNLAVADIGCGTGGMYSVLNRFGSVVGVDESPQAREYCAKRGWQEVWSREVWEADTRKFDLITAFDVVEHIDDDVEFLGSLAGRLNPGGVFLATVPAYPFLWSRFDELNHHKRRYTRNTLKRALEAAGFGIDRMTHFNALLLPPIAAVRLVERAFKKDSSGLDNQKEVESWFRVGPFNGVLEALFSAEGSWLRKRDLSAGCSIAAIAHPA